MKEFQIVQNNNVIFAITQLKKSMQKNGKFARVKSSQRHTPLPQIKREAYKKSLKRFATLAAQFLGKSSSKRGSRAIKKGAN